MFVKELARRSRAIAAAVFYLQACDPIAQSSSGFVPRRSTNHANVQARPVLHAVTSYTCHTEQLLLTCLTPHSPQLRALVRQHLSGLLQ
jgi:hypothetical protein